MRRRSGRPTASASCSRRREAERRTYTCGPADGTGTDLRLTTSANLQIPNSVTPNGAFVIRYENRPQTAGDLALTPLDVSSAGKGVGSPAEGLLETAADERNGEVSPNGRFLAYQSDDSGPLQIYVRPYPDTLDRAIPRSLDRWRQATGVDTRWERAGLYGRREPPHDRTGRDNGVDISRGHAYGVVQHRVRCAVSVSLVRVCHRTAGDF